MLVWLLSFWLIILYFFPDVVRLAAFRAASWLIKIYLQVRRGRLLRLLCDEIILGSFRASRFSSAGGFATTTTSRGRSRQRSRLSTSNARNKSGAAVVDSSLKGAAPGGIAAGIQPGFTAQASFGASSWFRFNKLIWCESRTTWLEEPALNKKKFSGFKT